ncbi:MAG: M20/M25/M40 family metallo-hydrolase [Oscillospiraceae bacterium]|nr:M20/M25/M40 family metallo-hydrolase [Oscillospiraceae bacterium]
MTSTRRRIEALFPTYLEFWETICRLETPSCDRAALNQQADVIEAFSAARGFSVRRQHYAAAGDTLVIELSGNVHKKHIALLAHMDTVHAPGAFGEPPVRKENGILYGPGVFDCKGGIAACLLAMEALAAPNSAYPTVKLILNSDEEDGSFIGEDGALFIQSEARGACAAFNAEAGRADSLTVGRKGILTAEIQVFGKAGHAGNAYFQAASAIREAAHKIIALEAKSNEHITYNCGLIHGGSASNIVPDECRITVDVRFQNAAQLQQAMKALDEITQNSSVKDCRAEWRKQNLRPAMECTAENLKLFQTVLQTALELGLPPLLPMERGGGSDSAFTVEIGIPTVCSMGPVGRYEHTVREEADINTLADRALLLAECIKRV